MRVLVCTWDPAHTLKISEAQQRAVNDGSIASMWTEANEDKEEMQRLLASRSLLSVKQVSGEPCCFECGTPMEWLYSADGVVGQYMAVKDVAENFDKAFERTRRRNNGREEDDEEE
jgi:hypothetical protein